MKRESRLKLIIAIGIVALFFVWTPMLLTQMKVNGVDAYKDQKYEASRKWLSAPAYLGDSQAQTLLGSMYAMGQGGQQDATAALSLLERAASANEVKAQTMLGALYSRGVVAKRDPEKAIFWLSKASGRGDQDAASMLRDYRLRPGAM